MTNEIQWFIGKEGTTRTRLDVPPFRAYFYWLKEGTVVESADFDKDELVLEIGRRVAVGDAATHFKDALRELQ